MAESNKETRSKALALKAELTPQTTNKIVEEYISPSLVAPFKDDDWKAVGVTQRTYQIRVN